MMRVAGLARLSLFIMQMQRNSSRSVKRRQSTLAGLWQRPDPDDNDTKNSIDRGTVTSREKKQNRNSSLQSLPQCVAPPLHVSCRTNRLMWENISLPSGPMHVLRGCVGGKNSTERRLTRASLASLPDWNENVKFKIFGKECQMRRRICQYSSGGNGSYSYSGLHFDAPEFPDVLYDIKCKVEILIRDYAKDCSSRQENLLVSPELLASNEIFNYCLCNHYRTGEDSMGYHADDEAALDHTAPIASVSFGITRNFDIRPRKKTSDGKKARVARVALGDGDLLLMLSPMQQHYEHAIPMEKRVSGERINLTFRRIKALKLLNPYC